GRGVRVRRGDEQRRFIETEPCPHGVEQLRLELGRDEQQVGGEDRDALSGSAQQQRVQLERIGHSAARGPAIHVARQRQRAVRRDIDRPGGDEGAALASLCYSRLL